MRGQIISLKENDYVRAAHAIGARWHRILFRHLLPNTLGLIIVFVFLELPGVVLGEAFLSFLGLGINPPNASWGSLAQDGYTQYLSHPHIIVIPSVAIAWLILSAFFIADGLRDALDPRTEESWPSGRSSRSTTSARTSRPARGDVHAVDGVSFSRRAAARRSASSASPGCGKSVTALSIMGLLRADRAHRQRLGPASTAATSSAARQRELEDIRGREIAMIFQDPMTSLNPTLTIGTQITETMQPPPRPHEGRGAQARGRACSKRCTSRTPRAAPRRLPAPLLGRHAPARDDRDRALVQPEAADRGRADDGARRHGAGAASSTCSRSCASEHEMAMIIITHDMGVVAEAADDIAVMYAGQIVEQATAHDLFDHPEHPYTEALLGALPQLEGEGVREGRLTAIPGRPPDLSTRPTRAASRRAARTRTRRRLHEVTRRSCARSAPAISCAARTRRASAPATPGRR